jgi:hypothetical protein
MKPKVGKEPVGVSKKHKGMGNDNSLASMFRKQQAACDLSQARPVYNAQLQKGKEMALGEAAQHEPVRRSNNDTHLIVESDTVDATVPKGSVDPNCMPKPFVPDTACETSVYDVLQDCITTAPRIHRWSLPKRAIKKA